MIYNFYRENTSSFNMQGTLFVTFLFLKYDGYGWRMAIKGNGMGAAVHTFSTVKGRKMNTFTHIELN